MSLLDKMELPILGICTSLSICGEIYGAYALAIAKANLMENDFYGICSHYEFALGFYTATCLITAGCITAILYTNKRNRARA